MKISKLGLEHIEQLAVLFDAYRQFYHQPPDLAAARDFLTARISNDESIIYGAFDDDLLLGFAQIFPLFSSIRMKPVYLLNDLFVLPELRNKRIGKSLLHHCQEEAKKNKRAGILLETDKINQTGNHLYPSVGFVLNEHANFYFWENKF